MQQVQALLQFREPGRVHVHFVRVARQLGLQLAQVRRRSLMQTHEFARARINPLQLVQRPPHDARLGQHGVFILREQVQRGLAELKQLRAIRRATVLLFDLHIFAQL